MNWKSDERGDLLEVFKIPSGGQVFLVNILPNQVRGNHYHTHKIEHFVVVKGTATINLRERRSGNLSIQEVNGLSPQTVIINPEIVHNIKAGQEGALLIVWCNEHFNPEDADTFFEVV